MWIIASNKHSNSKATIKIKERIQHYDDKKHMTSRKNITPSKNKAKKIYVYGRSLGGNQCAKKNLHNVLMD